MIQHSAISTQIVACSIILAFIFSVEIAITAVIASRGDSVGYDPTFIITAIIGLLLTLRLGKSHLVQNLLTNAILHAGPQCDRIVMRVRKPLVHINHSS